MVVGEIATGTEVLVIGGGPGGYVAAIRAAQLGKDVTVVENEALGGVCLNVGCIPSKALIHAADVYARIPRLAALGIQVKGRALEFDRLQSWKQGVVQKLTSGVQQLCEKNGVSVIRGKATFSSPRRVNVETDHGSQAIEFKYCIVATGARPAEIPNLPFDHKVVLDSTDALAMKKIPTELVVIGGGYIGLELGTAFAKLGSKVTIVEMMDQLLPGTDVDLVRVVERKLKTLGVEVLLRAKALGLKKGKDGAELTITTPNGERLIPMQTLLQSVGRRPVTGELGLEKIEVTLNEAGFIAVDRQMRTNRAHIFAVGDVTGGPLLAHKASHEGIVAAEVVAGLPSAADFRSIPSVIFTDPEIAYTGLTETEARERAIQTVVGRFPFAALGRALSTDEAEGFVKIVADGQSQVVLGVQIVGPQASNLISEAALAVEMGATLDDLALTIHPHPTFPEALMEAAAVALGRPIHVLLPRTQAPLQR